MEAGNALVTIDSNLKVGDFGHLLNGEIVPDGASTIPYKVMSGTQRFSIGNEIVHEVVDSFLRDVA